MRTPGWLLLTDYAGHAFTYHLAVGLADGGRRVDYSYCSTTVTPRASFDNPGSLRLHPVSTGRSFDKYRLTRRLISEVRYGFGTARVVWRTRPTTHVVCNMPLISLLIVWLLSLPLRSRLVIWLQDLQSGLVGRILGERHLAARGLRWLEGFLLRRAARVIAVSDELAAEAARLGASPNTVVVLENWAPVEQLPTRPKGNEWSQRHGLAARTVLMYSGTLARKHSPDVLLDLADAVAHEGAIVVVISEGEGSEWLRAQQGLEHRPNLILLPYQTFSEVPDALGSADILIVLLNTDGADFSAPSKTLSYLCAGRPVLAVMPPKNAAARIIVEAAEAGIVVAPECREVFLQEAVRLIRDRPLRERLARHARAYAVEEFAQPVVTERFVHAAELCSAAGNGGELEPCR